MYIASATGRGGEINRRKVPFKAEWGVDVADRQARMAALREGQIWAFFATKERAENLRPRARPRVTTPSWSPPPPRR